FQPPVHPPDLHSFPTRRSSDLIVCHRTGLDRHDALWYGSPLGREEIIHRVGRVKLNAPFRSTYQYQNIMYLTAGEAVGLAKRGRSEEHTSELQSRFDLVCRLLL